MAARAQALLIVLLLWAAVYLPALGSLPIKGEEGRRILPAVSMIETGNYLVPEVGGAAYFSKPPLINWLIVGSFKLFGVRNEWTARLSSAMAVLLVAIAFVAVSRESLGRRGSVFGAVIWLTSAGIIEKGRLAEIEALYVSLCALALICWLSFWRTKKSPWLVWIPASIFLGLGLLAKGPVHLIFFYAVVIGVVWQAKNWRFLFHPAHFVGILIMTGIFAAWAVPFAHSAGGAAAATKWTNQFSGRLAGRDFHFASWIFNIPRGLVYFLPWTIFLPFVRPSQFQEPEDRQFARALVWGAAFPFILVNLIPGALPRYSMPALVPACWLLAWAMASEAGALRFLVSSPKILRCIVASIAILACVIIPVYAFSVVSHGRRIETVKQLAGQIDQAIQPNEPVYALDPKYQPLFFYLRARIVYADKIEDLPADAIYLLAQPNHEQEILASDHWSPRRPHSLFKVTDYRKQSLILFKIE